MARWLLNRRELLAIAQFWCALGFTGFIALYERWLFPTVLPFVPERIPKTLKLVAQAVSLALVFAFVWLSLISRGEVRLAYLAVFALSVLAEYGAYYSVGRFSIAEDYDMTLRLVDPRLYFNAAVIYTGSFLPSALPILGYAACLFGTRSQAGAGWQYFAAMLLAFFVFNSLLVPLSSGVFRTLSLAGSLRTWTFLAWKSATFIVGHGLRLRR